MEIDPNIFFQKKSSRHHYIPKFLIDGFANSDGELFVFDKLTNSILDKPRFPKSIFFERDRNTVEIKENLQSSAIEDALYGKIDNQVSKVIHHFQFEDLNKLNFSLENISQISFFLITLLWRIPSSDLVAKDILSKSEINSPKIDSKILMNDPTFRKMWRNGLFKHHVDTLFNSERKNTGWINIHQSSSAIYLLGDNPILFRMKPEQFNEFDDHGLLIALSSKRIYSSTPIKWDKFPMSNSLAYNVGVITQSSRYVVAENLDILKKSIETYNQFQKENLLYLAPALAFKMCD